jgi:hypothetical protein
LQRTFESETLTVAALRSGKDCTWAALLPGLAQSVNAIWVAVDGGCVLTDVPPLARLFTLDRDIYDSGFHKALGESVHPGELTPAQFALVQSGAVSIRRG